MQHSGQASELKTTLFTAFTSGRINYVPDGKTARKSAFTKFKFLKIFKKLNGKFSMSAEQILTKLSMHTADGL